MSLQKSRSIWNVGAPEIVLVAIGLLYIVTSISQRMDESPENTTRGRRTTRSKRSSDIIVEIS
jgi:hypothetical protein